MKQILTIFILALSVYANTIQSGYWKNGETLLTFFEKHQIPQNLYYNLPKQDQESAAMIEAGTRYFYSYKDERLVELLLPISDELQIKVYYEDQAYRFTTVPIAYTTIQDSFVIQLDNSPYYDIVKHTGLRPLADEFVSIFKNSIDFSRSIRKGDKLVISYEQKMRLGKPHGKPTIQMAMIETNKRPNYLINYKQRYFNEKGIEVEGFYIMRPVSAKYSWISSRYNPKRWHPILKRYRAHLGVDYAANRGTRIYAAADGKVIYRGRKGGYGNTLILDHGNGFRTLYAHMKGYRSGVYRGKYVKRGQTIGYVGSTGLSTGPHLHFELQRRGTRVNPLAAVKIEKDSLSKKEKAEFKTLISSYKDKIKQVIAQKIEPKKIDILPDSEQTTLIAQAKIVKKESKKTL